MTDDNRMPDDNRSSRAGRRSRARKYGKRTLDFVLPIRCPLCGEPIPLYDGGELCAPCLAKYAKRLGERCDACGKVAGECTCSRLRAANLGASVIALGFYKTTGDEIGRLVYTLKHVYSRALGRFLARSLAARIMSIRGGAARDAIITFPPRSAEARRRYCFDHMRYPAKETARYLGASFIPALKRTRGSEQKTLDAKQRAENTAAAFKVADKYADAIKGRDVILVDDVATTGATLASAAKALLTAGAASVRFAVMFLTAERPQSESGGLWFEDDDAPDPYDDPDPLADDVGF